jgi:hypothetical protein
MPHGYFSLTLLRKKLKIFFVVCAPMWRYARWYESCIRGGERADGCQYYGALLLNFAATIYATYSNTTRPHGRCLFPCEIPIFALMLSGFERLWTMATMWLSCAMIGLFATAMSMGWIWYYSTHQWFE